MVPDSLAAFGLRNERGASSDPRPNIASIRTTNCPSMIVLLEMLSNEFITIKKKTKGMAAPGRSASPSMSS